MVIYSQWKNPRTDVGESSKKPSLTDRLAYEDISVTVKRFMQNPYVPSKEVNELIVDELNLPEFSEIDKVFNDGATEDIMKMDKVEQLEELATASRLAEQLRTSSLLQPVKSKEKALEAPESPEVVTDVAEQPKDA